MKKLIIGLSILFVLLAAAGAYWRWIQPSSSESDPIDAIPVSAAIIISFPDLNSTWETFSEQAYFGGLTSIDEFKEFFWRNSVADSLLRNDLEIQSMLQGSVIWTSFHPSDTADMSFFTVIKTRNVSDQRALNKLRHALSARGTLTEWKIGTTAGYRFEISNEKTTLYFCIHKGMILASSQESLIGQAIAQLSGAATLKNDSYLMNALNAAGNNVNANVLLHFERLPVYLKNTVKPSLVESQEVIGRSASWMSLDLSLKQDGFRFNGFTFMADSLNEHLSVFLSQQPQPILFPEVVPHNCATFTFFGFDNALRFASEYRKHLSRQDQFGSTQAELDSLNAYYGIDLEQNMLAWMGNYFGMLVLEPSSQSFVNESYAVFSARSEELASKLLEDLSIALAEKNQSNPEVLTINGITIRQLSFKGGLASILGDSFIQFDNPSYMIVNEHVIFGATPQALAVYLQSVQADKTLAKDLAFTQFSENLGSTFNVYTYVNTKRAKNIFESYLNDKSGRFMKLHAELSPGFNAFGIQWVGSGASFYTNAYLRYSSRAETSSRVSWECSLDANVKMAPVWVKNHLNDEPEVLVQDELNQLYLFNKAGQQLFKVKLNEPILSRPKQVDALKNGKLQYVFNSENFIYLIDREGNSVAGFPLKLSSPASTTLEVFDYDKDRDYRLLISCENKKVYNFDINGKIVSGWSHNGTSDLTIHPFAHLLVDGKDNIVTGEKNGTIHLLDRRGKNRVTVKKKVIASSNNHLQVFKSSESAFTGVYITDEKGLINRISLEGEVQEMNLGKFSPEHHFLVADLDKDGGPEFIISDLNLLQVYNYKKQKVFEERLDPTASRPFLIDIGEDGVGIGFVFKDAEQVTLYTSNGDPLKGFPLSGTSKFDVTTYGQETLVVSAGHGPVVLIQSVH